MEQVETPAMMEDRIKRSEEWSTGCACMCVCLTSEASETLSRVYKFELVQ